MSLERFEIDPGHSTVEFLVRHLAVSKVRGCFQRFHGTLLIDTADLEASSVEACVITESLDTNEPQRDTHLRSADFFDAAEYPEMCFTSTGVQSSDVGRLTIRGDLTLHGVTREVVLDGAYNGRVRDPWGADRVGLEATTILDRRDYGLVWNAALDAGGVLVGNAVEVGIKIEAVLRASPEGPGGATTP
ncbi:MAG TPA: YceI family protein [Coriobacteriia bacterium]|jgi:polyisoprenoid-binding protein YceI